MNDLELEEHEPFNSGKDNNDNSLLEDEECFEVNKKWFRNIVENANRNSYLILDRLINNNIDNYNYIIDETKKWKEYLLHVKIRKLKKEKN